MFPWKKNRNLMSSNCWKCIQIVNPTTTTLVLYYFKSFYDPIKRTFLALARAAPCLRACNNWFSCASLQSRRLVSLAALLENIFWLVIVASYRSFSVVFNQVTSVCFNDTSDQVFSGGIDNYIKVSWRRKREQEAKIPTDVFVTVTYQNLEGPV